MSNQYDNAYQILSDTINLLAEEKGRIKERLYYAVSNHFHLLWPAKKESVIPGLPEEFHDEYNEMLYALSKDEAKGIEGKFFATINNLSEEEAQEFAKKITSIQYRLISKNDPLPAHKVNSPAANCSKLLFSNNRHGSR